MVEGILAALLVLAALYFAFWLFILLPAEMAEARGRSALGWVLVSLFCSPFLAVFLLWLIGEHPHLAEYEDSD